MATTKRKEEVEVSVVELTQASTTFRIMGRTPLIFNRMAAKARRELLLPRGRLTAADKAARDKHDPLAEYRDSAYQYKDDSKPTRLFVPAPSFKGAMMSAALDLPGVYRTQVGRLLWVEGYSVDIYGIPQLRMDIVRMADAKRTPDVRTRACLPEWACEITVNYSHPLIKDGQVANLLASGGYLAGVGDFRQERGKGNFGMFESVSENDEDWLRITTEQGRAVQDAALEDPEFFDADAEELFHWFVEERQRRKAGPKVVKGPTKKAA